MTSLICLFAPFSACPQSQGDESFRLIILNDCWYEMKLGYDWESAFPVLMNSGNDKSLFIVSPAEISKYDWEKQVILLTEKATEALSDTLRKARQCDNAKVIADMNKRAGQENVITRALYTRAFVVRVNGVFLYGGIFLDPVSQMAIRYPVIRTAMKGGCASLAILPVHIPFVNLDPGNRSGKTNKPSFAGELKEDVHQLDKEGFLTEKVLKMAKSDRANAFREIIRDAMIKELFRNSGKLKE